MFHWFMLCRATRDGIPEGKRKEERIWNKKENTKKLLTMRLSLESDHVMEREAKSSRFLSEAEEV